MDRVETWIGICFGCILVAGFGGLGLGLMWAISRKNRRLLAAAADWREVPGRIVESKVVESRIYHLGMTYTEAEAKAQAARELPAEGPKRGLAIVLGLLDDPLEAIGDRVPDRLVDKGHWPLVAYEYQVDGVDYLNNRVRADEPDEPTRGGWAYSNQVIRRYPVGAQVLVYYDPADPRQSALER